MKLQNDDIVLLQNGNVILAQSANDKKYIVSRDSEVRYFSYWFDRDKKAEYLQDALDYFRSVTEKKYKRREMEV